jgi:glyoxylase-like metal-dependent hydrolase (beta-lactamase superfamily II)
MKQEQEPASTAVTEVGPNVLRMQLPIQMPGLGHVNTYALLDDRGAALVDPGLPGQATWKALESRLGDAGLKLRDIHTVVVTHSHPDHYGTAGRLASEGAEVVTHAAFYTWFGGSPHDCVDDLHEIDLSEVPDENPFGKPTPWGGEPVGMPRRRRMRWRLQRTRLFGGFTPPTPARRVRNGEVLKLAGREWVAVHTPGHTLDHLCLHDPEGGLFISGDHVLPTITPHISGLNSGRDPLANYFASLRQVATLGDQVTTVLPAHGHPFGDLAGRVKDIEHHHEGRLDKLRAASDALGPSTVETLSHELFRQARWGPMAESEAYAHLEYLRQAGRAERWEEQGKYVYRVGEAEPPKSEVG